MAVVGGRARQALQGVALALATVTVVGGEASAQSEPGIGIAQAQQRSFDIPPQPLAGALAAFGQQSGMQVSISAGLAQGVSSPGASGALTPAQALDRLLAGTGITYRVTGNTAMLQRLADSESGALQLDPVQVQGVAVPPQAIIDNLPLPYAGGQVATGGQLGLLGNRDVMDTPFNQTSYTAKKAQDQQAKTIVDILADDPSVRSSRSNFNVGTEGLRIRGFAVDPLGWSYGGLYGVLPGFSPMAELAEHVEVLKGPSVMLNGVPPTGDIGGTVNVVPKRAPAAPLTEATANYISAGQLGGHVDFARRFGEDKQFGVRANGVFRAGQTELQYNSEQRGLATLGVDYRGERVRLSGDFGFQSQYMAGASPYLGLADGVALPGAPSARTNPTAQPWGYVERKDVFGAARAEADLIENVTAYVAAGARDTRFRGMYSVLTTITNFDGDATAAAPFNFTAYKSTFTATAGVRAVVDTGPINHQFAVSATTFAQEEGQDTIVHGAGFTTNIYNPTTIARPDIATPAPHKTSTSRLTSIGIADTLSGANGRVQLTVGGRFQRVEAANFNVVSGAQTSSYDQSAFSPSVALVVKPFWENVSFYANFIQGLQQGAVVPQPFVNAGEIFPPYQSTQYEAGIKVDWGKLTTTASFFQISQPSILTNVATNTQYLGGEQVNQGFELNFFGEVTEGFRVLGGAMLLNAVLTKTQGGLTDGWIAPFSPGAQFNIGGEWDLPYVRGLTLTGRATYTGSQFIDTLSPRRSLPEWTRLDLGARYAFENPGAKGKLLVVRFNVENVLDSNYWAGGTNSSLMYLGAPRTFRLAMTADF
ncbi:TonB-dependent siderophore receptor [Reyranella sp.]|uniref:TonB-dependent siderophore receptor n=1 Tax=Reyranella sp. TaxID=1929291 RepID=UPI004035A288